MRSTLLLGALVGLWACGDDVSTESAGTTVVTVQPIQGDGLESLRMGPDEAIEVAGLARILLDHGPRLLAQGARLTVGEDGAVTLEEGRLFADVLEGDALELRHGDHVLNVRDASLSIAAGDEIYVVSGEVAHRVGESRDVIHGGERLALADGVIAPATLWHDWTGGLARPGPGLGEDVAIGALEGRVPDEVGQARWPLVIRRLDVRVRIVDDLAITEVDQVFFNPASETVEGLYRIRAPEGAMLQRFSVDRNGRMVDGYVREKAQARQAYERQVYRGSTLDPALLEWTAPGQYQARIYPIAAGEERRIAIRYAQWLPRQSPGAEAPGARVYRFPMAAGGEAPLVQELSVAVDLSRADAGAIRAGQGAEIEDGFVRFRRSDFRPRADFVLELEDPNDAGDAAPIAWRAPHEAPQRAPGAGAMPDEDEGDYVYVPLVLPDRLFTAGQSGGIDVVVIADVSAATDRHELELGRAVVESLSAHLGEEDRLAVVASDTGLRASEDGHLGAVEASRVATLLDQLARQPAGGASDLGTTLEEAAALLDPDRRGLVIYVGDGAPTVGELDAAGLTRRLEALPAPLRTYAVALGADSSLELLQALTRGGGLATRVETRSGAAEAVLRLLAHAQRPLAQRVQVELVGAEQVFPRGSVDVAMGEVLPIVGRADGAAIDTVRVRGEIAGQPFEETISLTERRAFDEGDLRLRWAGERLRQLLLSGGRREEVADLGVRYGIITPFTSFYVPSAAELARLGDMGEHRRGLDRRAERGTLAFASWLPWLSMTGCSLSAEDVGSASEPLESYEEENTVMPEAPKPTSAPDESEGSFDPDLAQRAFPDNAPRGDMPVAAASAEMAEPEAEPAALAPPREQGGEAAPGYAGLGLRGTGAGGGGTGYGNIGFDASDEDVSGRPESDLNAARARPARRRSGRSSSTTRPSSMNRAENSADASDTLAALMADASEEIADLMTGSLGGPRRGEDGDGRDLEERNGDGFQHGRWQRNNGLQEVTVTVRTTHRARRCSDASALPLSERSSLWAERLEFGQLAATVYAAAARQCELRSWRDRRAFLDLALRRASSVSAAIQLHRSLSHGASRAYVRRVALRRVRTPDQLRVARGYFGRSHDQALITQVLARAGEGASRVRALRRLIRQFPGNMDLQLMLLEELERLDRGAQARRVAQAIRQDPLADAGVRTAIGELFLRMGDEAEARRVFGEIVEFAPQDALARRRLGDLFRAYGWFDDAYRQYVTLATISPDDPAVLLLLAQAAAGAGRINEALSLEQQAAETAAPGQAEGLSRTALLWSSVRFAELRKAARESGDAEALRALSARMRRSGVLREASPLRVTLVWSHPEAALSLYGGYPGLSPTRPRDLSPEFGIEAFDVEEFEDGIYRIQVRRGAVARASRRRGHLTDQHAKLVVLWNEGQEDEKVEIIELTFEGTDRIKSFEVEGDVLREVQR